MEAEPIAIVGSTNRGSDEIQASARTAAYQLGVALARKKLRILVYTDEPRFLESQLVEGYLASGAAAERSIVVRYPEKLTDDSMPKAPPFAAHYEDARFTFLADNRSDWEVSYYDSFAGIGGMLILQGGRSALISGVVALGYGKPVVPCGGFGGTANALVSMVVERNLVLAEEKVLLQKVPAAGEIESWAGHIVEMLQTQAERLAEKRRLELRWLKASGHVMARHAVTAVVALALAIVLWLINLDNRLELTPAALLGVLFVCSGLSGAIGAMLRVILPYLRGNPPSTFTSVWSSVLLGLLAGGIAAMLFVIGQEHGLPELSEHIKGADAAAIIEHIKAGFFASLIPGSMLASLAAGAGLERVLAAVASGQSSKNE